MCIDITTGKVTYHDEMPILVGGDANDIDAIQARDGKMWFSKVPAGAFQMGAPEGEIGTSGYEIQHKVTISEPFYVGVFEVTQRQWLRVMGNNPSTLKYEEKDYNSRFHPVENVSYDMIRGTAPSGVWPESGSDVGQSSFIGRLRAISQLELDLPTEAQWEYACRAGTKTALNTGKDLSDLDYSTGTSKNMSNSGRYVGNSENSGHADVGSNIKYKNKWNLFDMHGNVAEWCLDWMTFSIDEETDPVGMSTAEAIKVGKTEADGLPRRIVRGGAYVSKAQDCRSAARASVPAGFVSSSIGFRLVCKVKAPKSRKLTSLTIDGPAVVDACSFANYNGKATFSDGTVEEVVGKWIVTYTGNEFPQLIEYGNINYAGALYNGVRPADKKLELKLEYGSGGTKKQATRKIDMKAQHDLSPMAYMVIDLTATDPSKAVRYSSVGPDVMSDVPRTTELWLRKIPAGEYLMGAPDEELGREHQKSYTNSSGKTVSVQTFKEKQHRVTITKPFYIGVYELTQGQWEKIMGSTLACSYNGASRPVDKTTYALIRGTSNGAKWPDGGHLVDASSFMGKLREKTGIAFDLPTEAQWEYACRAGTETSLNNGENILAIYNSVNMDYLARYYFTERDEKGAYYNFTRSGSYAPNAWGLYDMHGNVREWCLDWGKDYDGKDATDPVGASSGKVRIVRGGNATSEAWECRSASRIGCDPAKPVIENEDLYNTSNKDYGFGFRVVCPIEESLSVVPQQPDAYSADAQEKLTLTVTSNVTWHAVASADWITLNTSEGMTDGTIEFALAANSNTERNGTITVETDGGSCKVEIPIVQGISAVKELEISGSEVIQGGRLETYTCYAVYESNAREEVMATWTFDGQDCNGTVVNDNDKDEDVTGVLKATSTVDGKTMDATKTVTLKMRKPLSVSPESIDALSAAVNKGVSVNVMTDDSWTVSCDAEWITIAIASGTGNGKVVFDVDANLGDRREAVLDIESCEGRICKVTVVQASRVLSAIRIIGDSILAGYGEKSTYYCLAEYDNGENEKVTPIWTLDGQPSDGTVFNDNEGEQNVVKTLAASYAENNVTKSDELQITLIHSFMSVIDFKRGWNVIVLTMNLKSSDRNDLLKLSPMMLDMASGAYHLVQDAAALVPGTTLWIFSGKDERISFFGDKPDGAFSNDSVVPEEPGSWIFRCFAEPKEVPKDAGLTIWLWAGDGKWELVKDMILQASKGYLIYRK
ncbi:MAG: SUMF1/EgtB/PvdO family nonheme iron enzyme [Victivallales bacterium]|nr:SUMF1/EgtB/PvdO family nonheme iron enzyme [Victivallales bacterium]